jgi:CBS domain containing-hemolysin-like protein
MKRRSQSFGSPSIVPLHPFSTLLVANAAALEALPLLLSDVVPEWVALVLSITLVLVFGEIIPQAWIHRNPLAVCASCSWLVWTLLVLFALVVYPLAALLDCVIGLPRARGTAMLFRRHELESLVALHGPTRLEVSERMDASVPSHHGSCSSPPLLSEEVGIIRGALSLTRQSVLQV